MNSLMLHKIFRLDVFILGAPEMCIQFPLNEITVDSFSENRCASEIGNNYSNIQKLKFIHTNFCSEVYTNYQVVTPTGNTCPVASVRSQFTPVTQLVSKFEMSMNSAVRWLQ